MIWRVFAAGLILASGIWIGKTFATKGSKGNDKVKLESKVQATSVVSRTNAPRAPASHESTGGTNLARNGEQLLTEVISTMTMSQISEFFDDVKRGSENVWLNSFNGTSVGTYPFKKEMREHRKYIKDLSGKLFTSRKSYRLRGTWRASDMTGNFDIFVESTDNPQEKYGDKCLKINGQFFNETLDEILSLWEQACVGQMVLREGTYYAILPLYDIAGIRRTFSMIAVPMPFGAKHIFEFIPDGGESWTKAAGSGWEVLSQEQRWELVEEWNSVYNEWLKRDSAKLGLPPPQAMVRDENGDLESPDE